MEGFSVAGYDVHNEFVVEFSKLLECQRFINESVLRLIMAEESLLKTKHGNLVNTHAWQALNDIPLAIERINVVAQSVESQISYIRSQIFQTPRGNRDV